MVDELEAEQDDLRALLETLDESDWTQPTPAVGWDVRDQVSHLADTEEWAVDTLLGGPRAINEVAGQFESADEATLAGCLKGREMTPAQVLDWWVTAATNNRKALRAADPSARVPWGLGMGWTAFVTARLMEHWAHGLDIRAAVDRPGTDTDRLRHVAWICVRSLPYAFRAAGVEPPPGHTLRVELGGPSGDVWAFGPEDATDTIRGPAGVWCRRAVQRITPEEAGALHADGPLAHLAVRHARAFL